MRPVFLRRPTRFSHILLVPPVFALIVLLRIVLQALAHRRAGVLARIVAMLVFVSPLTALADQNGAHLRLAEAAMAAGDYALAERELLPLTREKGADPQAVKLLTETYWRTGSDKKLLDLTERHYSGKEKDIWWCRVLERRGHAAEAAECWFKEGEDDRGRRALRAKVFTQELAPGRAFGVRRD